MAIVLPQGFRITNNEPVDSRISVADQGARLSFSVNNVYEGLTVYQRDVNSIFVLTDATDPTITGSWSEITLSTGSEAFIITGSVEKFGDHNVLTFDAADSSSFTLDIFPFPFTGSARISGSLFIEAPVSTSALIIDTPYSPYISRSIEVNSDGVVVLGESIGTPEAVAGGLLYTNNEYFLGFS